MSERERSGDAKSSGNREVTSHLAEAEAALMLVELLMITLIERGVLTRQELSEILEISIETKRRFVLDGTHPEISRLAAGKLTRILNGLSAVKSSSGER